MTSLLKQLFLSGLTYKTKYTLKGEPKSRVLKLNCELTFFCDECAS